MFGVRSIKMRQGVDQSQRWRRGTVATEFALVALPLIMLVLGVVELGQFFWVQNILQRGCERGARYIYANSSIPVEDLTGAIPEEVKSVLTGIDANKVLVESVATEYNGVSFINISTSYQYEFSGLSWLFDDVTIKASLKVPVQ